MAVTRSKADNDSLQRSLATIVLAAGSFSGLLGLAAILDQYAPGADAFGSLSTFVFMPFTTALGFVVCGAGLVALALGQRVFSVVFGGAAALIGSLMAAQSLGWVKLALDQRFLEISTGWVAPGTAFGFLLSGTVLLAGAFVSRRASSVLFAVSGGLVLEFGLIAFFGFELGLATIYGSGQFTGMTVSTLGFATAGTGLLVNGWRRAATDERPAPAWLLPLAAGLGSVTLMGLLCQAVISAELVLKARGMRRVTHLMAGDIRNDLNFYVQALERMAKRTHEDPGGPARYSKWEEDATRYLVDFPGLMGLAWIGEGQDVEWVSPLGEDQPAGLDLAETLLEPGLFSGEEEGERLDETWMSGPLDLTTHEGKWILVIVPVDDSSGAGGSLVGQLDVRSLFSSYASQLEALGLSMQLSDGQGPFYFRTSPVKDEPLNMKQQVSFEVLDKEWELEVWPRDPYRFGVPVYSLIGAGVVLAFLLAAMVYFWQTSRTRARNIHDINEELRNQISEREIVQGELRAFNDTLELRIQQRTREVESSRQVAVNMMQQANEAQHRAEQAENQLREYARELQRSNTDLERFAFIASHDLKSPLRAIQSLSTWIGEDLEDQLTDESRRHMELLHGRVRRMEAMVDALLEYSRAGRKQYDEEEVAIADLIEEIKELLDLPQRFRVCADPDLPVLWTQKAPLQQVLANLIGNAVKHHDRPDGRVVVRGREKGSFFEFCVSDDGPGIPAEYHEKIFELFQTLQSRDKVESTGIGLALVKRIVEWMGGSIGVISEGKRGTEFRFEWPGKRIEGSEM